MANCHEMKMDQVWRCEDCGVELRVIKECAECEAAAESCTCETDCSLECCGKPLKMVS